MEIHLEKTQDPLILSALNESVQEYHHVHYPADFKAYNQTEIARAFEEMLSSADCYAYVARVNQEPVGYILCFLQQRKENAFQYAQRNLHIDQIGIKETHRKMGIGQALMHHVFKLAHELNVDQIQLDHWAVNVEAKRFFEHLGFELSKANMRLSSKTFSILRENNFNINSF